MSSWAFNISADGDSTTFLGNVFQCLNTLTARKVLYCDQMEFHVFQFVPFASCPLTVHHSSPG